MDKFVFRVDKDGITAPQFSDILEGLQNKARDIFGQDVNVDPDTQDGQLIAIVAAAIHDVNCQAINTYNAFSPATASGAGLDIAVKTNGIARRSATRSTVDLTVVGRAGTEIRNGYAEDEEGTRWNLPERVYIGLSGETTVTAVANEVGDISAQAGAVHVIGTPTYGWQSVVNAAPAVRGVAVETDSELRKKQTTSTMLPSVSLFESILSSVANLKGVKRVSGRNIDTDHTSAEGIPAHSVAVIVDGGDVNEIARTVFLKKGNGTGTHGDSVVHITDQYGFDNSVRFSRPKNTLVYVKLSIQAEQNYVNGVNAEIKQRVIEYINRTNIGADIRYTRVLANAIKQRGIIDDRFYVEKIQLKTGSGRYATANLEAQWNEAFYCTPDSVEIEVLNAHDE